MRVQGNLDDEEEDEAYDGTRTPGAQFLIAL